MGFSHCLFLVAFAGTAVAWSGQYVPKSFYVIDQNGQKSDVVYIRNRRDFEMPLIRVRRGGGSGAYASSSAQASASASSNSGSGGGGGGGGGFDNTDYIPDISPHLANFASNFPGGLGGGAGARSFASSSSSSYSGGGGGSGGGSGYGNSGTAGGLGAGNQAGYDGPILFSRFGEDKGSGVQVSGAAQGPKAAFSSSSSSVDGNGNVKYNVQSGKY